MSTKRFLAARRILSAVRAVRLGIRKNRPRPRRCWVEAIEGRVLLAGVSFDAERVFYIGGFPSSVMVGDFNGDGKCDLATTDGGTMTNPGNRLSVLLGNGDGTFQGKTDYTVGTDPCSVTVGDFNGDGKCDLITGSGSDNTVSVLLGNGDGTFQGKTDYTVSGSPISVTVGNFNGDGKSDLATANGNNTVSILLGNGDGTFQGKTDYTVGGYPSSVMVGDFNGDGKCDLATTIYYDNTVSILLGNGDGTFQSKTDYTVGGSPISVTVGDFNGDGKSDLATANGNNTVSILLGNGDGTFQGKTDYTAGTDPRSVAVGDFNGDGKSDLATANYSDCTVSVLLGNGDGTFQGKIDYTVGTHPRSVAVGDFNGDGKSDLAAANNLSGTVGVLLGNGDGTFQSKTDYTVGTDPRPVTVGDFNGDGKCDLAIANSGDGTVSILLGNGDGTFQGKTDYTVGTTPYSVTVGDFNGDGKSDLATANYSDCTVSVLLGNGDGTFQGKIDYTFGTTPYSVAVGDFNGDGKSDLATARPDFYSTVSVLLGNGDGTFQGKTTYSVGRDPHSVTVGDFNGDGKSDLATANYGEGTVSVLLSNDNGTFQGKTDYFVGYWPISVTVGDFNGDGKCDLATANLSAGTVSILLGNGDGTFQGKTAYTASGSPISVTVGDFNGDGKSDLATAHGEMVSILLGNGDGTFKSGSNFGVGSDAWDVRAGDFNGDGKCDLATTNRFDSTVSILLNTTPFSPASNHAPSNIGLSSSAVVEGQSSGTAVGTFTTTDPDANNTFTYSLVSGTGSTDNASFAISNNTLQTAAVFNYASKKSYSIRVRSTDQGGLYVEKVFAITVTQPPTVYLLNSIPTAYEGYNIKGQMLLYRTGPTTNALTVNYTVSGTANDGTHYQQLTGTATFAAGKNTATIDVVPVPDNTADPTLPVTATLVADPNNYAIAGNYDHATVNIIDDAPTIYLWSNAPTAYEGVANSKGQMTVYRTGSTAQAVTVKYAVSGTANDGAHYQVLTGSVTINAGFSTATIDVVPEQDNTADPTLPVTATLEADDVNVPSYHMATNYKTATVNIIDDAPTVYLLNYVPTAYEGVANSKGQMMVYRTGSTAASLTVNYAVGGTANDGVHYQQLGGSVTFAAGKNTATIDVVPVEDGTADPTLPVTATLAASTAYNQVNGYKTATVNIIDDAPTVYLWSSKPVAYESGIGKGQMTLYRTGATTQPLTVLYAVSGTANDGTHYQQLTGTATFASGKTIATIDVIPVDDGMADPTLTVTASLVPDVPPTYHIGNGYTTATVSIIDDAPTIYMWTAQPYAYKSGLAKGKGTFAFYRTGSTAQALTVNYSVLGGTATSGTNFQALTGQVAFGVGETIKFVDLIGVNDPNQQTYLTVIVGLDQGSAYHTLNVYCTATGYILNA